ncbi:nucleoside-specific channel-forming Tsx family protein [Porphyromonas loveana]|uniref:Uncharacterized protein DUF5020 n=4 Tax=Porphyromonas loveana TaxID=1884669 RepID=A0A2U1FPD8_9PORP|nr:DUF5020 family protein [Porphyromonas loveana]PVZ14006.1 uncharacterized protein DUF5020 [Porphyromonas loveana]
MLKKVTLLGAAMLLGFGAKAQNIQMHYDFGSGIYDELGGRPKLTTTVENFTPDKWGSTYFFVDMDYTGQGIQTAYWEIARNLQFWQGPLSVHIEYNGGLSAQGSFGHDFLAGGTYTYNDATFTKGFSFSPMYKHLGWDDYHTFQLTGTWYMHFVNGLLTFNGFFDLWGCPEKLLDPGTNSSSKNDRVIFLAEPQFWLNLNRIKGVDKDFNLSIGTEWEISRNFARTNSFAIIPTLGLKWTFK